MSIEIDYTTLYWNIHGAKKSIFELYPILNIYPEFKEISEKELKYVIYLYSQDTPLTKLHKDNLGARKQEALKLAGIKFTEDIQVRLFDFKDPAFTASVVRFLAIQNNGLWSNIVVNQQAFNENISIIMAATTLTDDKKITETAKLKSQLLEMNGQIADRLNGYYKTFFRNDIALENEGKKVELRLMTPEAIASIERSF